MRKSSGEVTGRLSEEAEALQTGGVEEGVNSEAPFLSQEDIVSAIFACIEN